MEFSLNAEVCNPMAKAFTKRCSDSVKRDVSQSSKEELTSWGGVPLLIRAIRSLRLPESIRQHLQICLRERGFDEASMVESFLVLNAVGG